MFFKQANQLDFLLSKASEYSNFIAQDLQELQNAMAQQAQKEAESSSTTTGGKKRKGSTKKGRAAKKQKKNDASAAALKSAQDKHKAITGGERPIFIQPPLLKEGCVLKDYQLEGVRWLTSLFENGVSGILADEMVSTDKKCIVCCNVFLRFWSVVLMDVRMYCICVGTGENHPGDCYDCSSQRHESPRAIHCSSSTSNSSKLDT